MYSERHIDVPREIWDPTEVTRHSRYGERPLDQITGLEVHWAGTGSFEDHGDTETELLAFESFHEVSKGWYDLFYNVGVDYTGTAYEGRNATIRSQSNLNAWLTLLVVAGEGDGPPPAQTFQKIYEIWGEIDPSRNPATLRIHKERSATSCPGPHVERGVQNLRAGWVPIANQEKNMSGMSMTKLPSGEFRVYHNNGYTDVNDPAHWAQVILDGNARGWYESPYMHILLSADRFTSYANDGNQDLSDDEIAALGNEIGKFVKVDTPDCNCDVNVDENAIANAVAAALAGNAAFLNAIGQGAVDGLVEELTD